MEPFLLQCASFATFATAEVVAEMIDMRTLDGCKDMMFEARTMFEVVGEVLCVDKQRLKGSTLSSSAQVSEWFAQVFEVSEDVFAQVSEDVKDSVSRLRRQKHPR